VLLNSVSYHPDFQRLYRGSYTLGVLEWDIKAYMALNGALHDAAIATWGAKGYYDTARPVSAIRYMAERGQSTYRNGSIEAKTPWSAHGFPLIPNFVEAITDGTATCLPVCKHTHLRSYIGEVAVRAWRGPYSTNPNRTIGGVGWIRAKEWWPYQKVNFVSPPYGEYISGHAAFSRCAAEVRDENLFQKKN